MIHLPNRINPAKPGFSAEIKPYTIVQIYAIIDQYNAAESGWLKAQVAADNLLAPYQTPEGVYVPRTAPMKIQELKFLLSLSHFNPILCRWPVSRSVGSVSIAVANWRQTTMQLQSITTRINSIVAAITAEAHHA